MPGLGGLGFKRTAAELFWTWYIKCVCTTNAQYPNILTDLCNNILLNSSKIQIAANEVLEHLFIGIPIPCCCCYMASASLDCGYDEYNLRCITWWVVITSQCLLSISFMQFIDVTKALCRGPSACCAELNWKWHHKLNFSIIINVVEAIEGVMPSVTSTSETQIKSSYLFSLKCIVFKVFLFQAVLDVRNGPGPSVQFTENGGVSTILYKEKNP